MLDFIVTTTHHDLHHQHGRSNYGLYFTFWDRLLNTRCDPSHRHAAVLTTSPSNG